MPRRKLRFAIVLFVLACQVSMSGCNQVSKEELALRAELEALDEEWQAWNQLPESEQEAALSKPGYDQNYKIGRAGVSPEKLGPGDS